jgi:Fic family protein
MHEILLSGVHREGGLYKAPGEFRLGQAFIGRNEITSARYVAPPQDRVEKLMGSLEAYIDSESPFPALVNASLLHYQFEAIHPFSDGNGRIGRALISLYLCAAGILPEPLLYRSAYFERNKKRYVNNLWEISRSGAWKEWLLFFLNGVKHEAKDAVDRSRKLIALREQYRNDLQPDGGAASLIKLVDELFQWPVLTTRSAQKILGMTYQGAKNNIDKLCERKIIVEVTGNDRYRLYLARPIIALIS